ncbi:MAG TPA: cell division protein ZapA [Stellaceae bacterium]|nr:cell division protein ZapA [Stellaceae bacterium]
MAQVTLTINGRSYPVACDDGQEDRIRQLGQYIERKVAEFAAKLGQIGDARLILMAALVITDELAEATEAMRRQRQTGNGAGHDRDAATEAVLAAGIESLAARIEAVAARLEGTT